jgi:chromosome segregation ATPase
MKPEGQSSAEADNSQASSPNFQAMKIFIEAVRALSSDASFRAASAVMDETTKLQKQVESKDEELAKLRTKINDLERTKEMVYNEMFEANQKEKNKQAEILTRVTGLQATVREKENALTEQEKMIDVLKIQIEKLETMHENEKADAERAHKDVNELQQKLKERDDLIENMKDAESTMKEKLTTAESKVEELEKTNASLKEQLETSSARLQELEGFAVQFHEEKEESLYAIEQILYSK